MSREVFGRFPFWQWIKSRSGLSFYEWCLDRAWSFERAPGSAINPPNRSAQDGLEDPDPSELTYEKNRAATARYLLNRFGPGGRSVYRS